MYINSFEYQLKRCFSGYDPVRISIYSGYFSWRYPITTLTKLYGETSNVQIYSLQIIFFCIYKDIQNIIHFGFKDGVSMEASRVIYLD